MKFSITHLAPLRLTADGGSNDFYYRLMQASARSGAPGAADVWVKHSSRAKDADPEDKLRSDFDRCRNAADRSDDVTIGTLLHYAKEQGADFDRWKRLAIYAPFLP